MPTDGKITLAVLHDLALLYLGLAHGTDKELDPAEVQEIALKLRQWQPDKDPALIDHVIREATLSYINDHSRSRLREAVDALGRRLDARMRLFILQDLRDIAQADGAFVSQESDFIQRVSEIWGLAKERSS